MRGELIREVEQFLYREARLLDERRFHEWLELFTDDVRYWMVTRSNLYARSSKAIAILNPGRTVDETTEEDGLAILDESKKTLEGRIARLETGMAWAEDPPSRTRHLIGNLEATPLENGEVSARTAFLVYRSHLETDHQLLSGSRKDMLRQVDGAWKVARRKIVLDANVLLDKNLSVFL